ncbi:ATP-binding protein [Cognatiyoonia sp. IB215446]|uniref:sensor histidine kinase n=1 Tax=Cognatiyoonia sp. IB215446 TaxID=3097355 RepID=UPI002A1417EC|nr:ATP-binding protein [Cognatiyoonia sp. IB215446]MDX8349413.1 ATP-binding protein [Cognatiyoonia sp. IB215446]
MQGTALLGFALVIACVAFVLFPRVFAFHVQRSQDDGAATLRLVSEAMDQSVARFSPLPSLIASDPSVIALLEENAPSGVVPFMNEKLRNLQSQLGTDEIYIMDADGLTIAASNYREPTSFVGRNFVFRPYFEDAMSGQVAMFHALGITTRERGFYFAAPVLDGIEILGVLVVKVQVNAIEATWADAPFEIIVADPLGVAFLSSRPAYKMRALAPLSGPLLQEIARTQQFPVEAVTPIPFSADVLGEGAVQVTLGDDQDALEFLSQSQPLNLPGWHAIVLSPLEPVRAQTVQTIVLLCLAIAVVALSALILIQRRLRANERRRAEQTQRDTLEALVRDRTAALGAANQSLEREIEERRTTEDILRRTQKDLVQAGKLAALGQMSAALSHEINQPLAAVKSYADNAAAYLQRGRLEEVGTNVARISDMTDRVASISKHLRNFARQPGETLSAVPVLDVIEDAIAVIEPRARQAGATIRFDPPDRQLAVMAGRLRLQQVVVNIVSNAIDATEEAARRDVIVTVEEGSTHVALNIRDHGTGLDTANMEQVFDAFYTTKPPGAGLGLGLSISYNIVEDFGGKLSAVNHPDGGALFTITLNRAEMVAMIAE